MTDLVGILDHAAKQRLVAVVGQVQRQTGAEIAILVVPSTAPESIEDYSISVFDQWKIGRRGKDNGVLFLVAVQDRRLRITTGYGLEGVLPDGKVGEIRDRDIVPFFRAGRYADGIVRGTEVLAAEVLGQASGVICGETPQARPRPRFELVLGCIPMNTQDLVIIPFGTHLWSQSCMSCWPLQGSFSGVSAGRPKK